MSDKIIKSGTTREGEKYTIRSINKTDAKKLQEYINTLSKEQTFIMYQGEQQTLKEEQEFLDKQLKAIEEKKAVHLVLELNGKIIGGAQLNLKRLVCSHVGHIGIGILNGYRNQGIGRIFLTALLNEAIKEILELKIIDLTVYEMNERAKHLYQSVGFIEYGRLPGGIKYKGQYIDEIYMYKNL